MRFRSWSLLPAVLALSFAGCGDSHDYVPVSGQVIIDGEPVEGCTVTFTPITGSSDGEDVPAGSYATTGKDGRYTLKVLQSDIEGAAVGKHRVYLSTGSNSDNDAFQLDPRTKLPVGERVPDEYRNGKEVEVPEGGTDSMDFRFEGVKPR